MTIGISSIASAASSFASDAKNSAARSQLANARFHQLLDYCANALGESVQATEELSQRLSYLRKEIETHARHGPTNRAADPLVRARRRAQEEPAP